MQHTAAFLLIRVYGFMLLLGKNVADNINKETKIILAELNKQGVFPCLYVLSTSDNKGVSSFIKSIESLSAKIGIKVNNISFDKNQNIEEISKYIDKLNADINCRGILITKPFFDIDVKLNSLKDIDGYNCKTKELLSCAVASGNQFIPSVATAVESMLNFYSVSVKNKKVCIIGDSLSVGYACGEMLKPLGADVTMCNEFTKNIEIYTQQADIIISCCGIAKLINSKWIGNNMPVIIDLGFSSDEMGNISGDVDFEDVKDIVSAITPVPGGIGLVTTAVLLNNLAHVTYNEL